MKQRHVGAISGLVLGIAGCGAMVSGVEDKTHDGNGSNQVAPGSPDAGAPRSHDSGVGMADASTSATDAGTAATDAGTAATDASMPATDAGTAVTLGLRRGATLADLDTLCGSVTARDVLALLKDRYSPTFVYESKRSPSAALTIQTKYDHGLITCAPNFCPCDPPPPPAQCRPCSVPPTLYIDLVTTFRTDDGSFNEQFVGTAEYLPGNNDPIDIYGLVPAASFSGTFPNMFGTDETFVFEITLSGSNTSGVVSEVTATTSAGAGNWSF